MAAEASSDDQYILKRDYNASTRLNAGHFFCELDIGHVLHPSISLPSNPKVADVATGNGIWLLNLARHVPQPRSFVGFDISLDQAPTSYHLADSGIAFETWNMFKEPPPEYHGIFDLVHVRLVTIVFQERDHIVLMQNLQKLLKPGGYLQWDEVDTVSRRVDTPSGVEAPLLKDAMEVLGTAGALEWKQNAADLLNQYGFKNAKQIHIEPDKLYGRQRTDWYLATWAEFQSKESLAEKKDRIMEEVRKGATAVFPMWVWVAQKA